MPDFGVAIIIVIICVLAIFSLRVRFDLNEWLRDRHNRRVNQLKNICTHTKIHVSANGDANIGSFFHKPSGTDRWICDRCGLVTLSDEFAREQRDYWAAHPKEYRERERKFARHVKKVGLA